MAQSGNCCPEGARERIEMAQIYCRASIVLLVATVCLVFGVPAQADPISQDQASPAHFKDSDIASGSDDGFQRTVRSFQLFEKKGSEISAVLKNLHAEVVAVFPGDTTKQQEQFLKKLTELYPGSKFDGATGTVAFQKDFVATFGNTLNIDSISEVGAVTVTYIFGHGVIQLSDGISSVTINIDRTDPSRSKFSKVAISAIKDEAENILTVPGYKRIVIDTVETSILNDAYQLLTLTNALRMDFFAADVMRYPALQRKALGIAGKGYYERHSSEYQVGTEPAKPVKKIIDGASNSGKIDVVGFIARFLLILVSAAGVFWVVFTVIRQIKFLFMDNATKQRIEKYNSLSPMVIRSLKRLGASLWGNNYVWAKRYYVSKHGDRWLLCDGKNVKNGKKSLVNNRLEVCMRDSNFKLKVTRLNGVGVDVAVICKDFSEQELTERLMEIRALLAAAIPAPGMPVS